MEASQSIIEEPNEQPEFREALAMLEQLASFAGMSGQDVDEAAAPTFDFKSAAARSFDWKSKTRTVLEADDQAPAAAPEALAPRKQAPKGAINSTTGRTAHWQPDVRYRALVERLPVVTFMAGLDDKLQDLYISPQIEELLGFTQDEWLENPFLWFRQLHPEDREAWVAEFALTCATGAHFRAEYRLIASDGRVVWVQGECQIIRNEEGWPLFLQGIAFDITHRKQAAVDSAAKLAAEAASRAKSEFLARMSHEIRTPLNGVVGMIDLLLSTGMTDVQRRYAGLAREAGDSLLMVINDILDFSKIEAGKVEMEAVEFDLHRLIEDLTELLAPVAAKKNLALASFLRPGLPRRFLGDPTRIRQVLTNLINNALKFTAAGHVAIRAALERAADDAVFVRVQVEDTGIGIPPDRLDRLFKSFSQVDSSTTRKYGGTGLGLAISKRLVELMGGEIGITSELNKGTTFWFTLKLLPIAVPPAQAAPAGNAQQADDPASQLRRVRVLAAESDPTYRRILTEQFDGWLAPLSRVVGCDEALGLLRSAAKEGHPFSVALVPYGTSTGGDLAAEIRGDPALRPTHLIAVMNIDEPTDSDTIRQKGFYARLHRPLTQSRLLDVVASATVQRDTAPVPATAAKDSAKDMLKGLHLLVAEDNEMNQFVTRETLKRAGCDCDIVADGALAVEAVRQRRYDLVLMDCQMPGMDGLEATGHIRQREAAEKLPHIPIIALTAEAVQGDREKCLAAGMDGYVSKPINAEELFATIRSLAPARGGQSETAVAKAPAESAAAPANTTQNAVVPASSNAPAETSAAPIDVDSLFGRCMRDGQFATRTLEKFQARAVEDVGLLRKGIAAGDMTGSKRLAHNLMAIAAHVAAGSLRKIAHEIEQATGNGELKDIEAQLQQLDREARRCAQYVPQAIERIASLPAPTGPSPFAHARVAGANTPNKAR